MPLPRPRPPSLPLILAVLSLAASGEIGDAGGAPAPPAGRVHSASVWTADRLHRIRATTVVRSGDTLRIEAGATVVAEPGASLVVERGGVLEAVGSASLPIVLTCDAAVASPGCWEGVVLRGQAPINHGSATSPDGGCLEAGGSDAYGGCDAADSSGRLRFVRIEHAGLRLEGVGAGTEIDAVQVHRAAVDGVALVGGTVDVRHLHVSGAAGAGFGWSGGWAGRAQHLVVVADPAGYGAGISGTSAPGPPSPDASAGPTVAHATVLAPWIAGGAGPDAPALRLAGGAGGRLANLLLVRPGAALDVDDAATCAALDAGILSLEGILVAGPTWLASPDPDPASCSPADTLQSEAERLVAAGAEVLVEAASVDGLLESGPGSPAEDLRPAAGSRAGTGAVPLPADGFFDGGLAHRGGVGPGIPWYLGWTRSPAVDMPAAYSGLREVGGEVLLDLELAGGSVVGASVARRGGWGASPGGPPAAGSGGPARSVIGTVEWEALPVPGSFTVSEVGAFVPGKVRVSFDLRLRNLLSFADFVTVESGFPATPDSADALFLVPFEETILAGAAGGAPEIPAGDLVRPSEDWDGPPFNFFPGGPCVAPDDCVRWEGYPSPLSASDTSAARTVGYDLDPSVGSFRVRLLIAADLRDAAP